MARLKFLAFVAPAMLLAFYLMPSTAWILRRQIDWLTGVTPYRNDFVVAQGTGIENPNTWRAGNPDVEVIRAYDLTFDPKGDRPHLPVLIDYCKKNPQDVRGWAFLTRRASMAARMYAYPVNRAPNRIFDAGAEEQHKLWNETMLEAARKGQALDPQNAFFVAMEAAALHMRGDLAGAKQALLRASQLTHFKDYTHTEAFLRINAIEDRWGFHGYGERAMLYGVVLFPHVTFIRNLAELTFDAKGNADERLRTAAVLLGRTIGREGDDAITIVIGRSMVSRALIRKGKGTGTLTTEEADNRFADAARKLDKKVGGSTYEHAWNEVAEYSRRIHVDNNPTEEGGIFERTAVPPVTMSLLGVFVAAIFLGCAAVGLSTGLKNGRSDEGIPGNTKWLRIGMSSILSVTPAGIAILIALKMGNDHLQPLTGAILFLAALAMCALAAPRSRFAWWIPTALLGSVAIGFFSSGVMQQLKDDHTVKLAIESILNRAKEAHTAKG
jgi:hypothetical protein